MTDTVSSMKILPLLGDPRPSCLQSWSLPLQPLQGWHLFPPFCHTCMPVAGIHLKNAQDGFPITNVGNDEEDKSSTKDVGNDNLTLSSPQGVGGDPSSQCPSPERFRMKMPGVTERNSSVGASFIRYCLRGKAHVLQIIPRSVLTSRDGTVPQR